MIISYRDTLYTLLFAVLVANGCAAKKKYAETNKIHRQHVEEVVAEIAKPLPPPAVISSTVFPADTLVEGTKHNPEWVGAVHFGLRRPNYVIIHHTAQDSVGQTLRTFTLPHTEVSAHYLIGKDGRVYQMLSDYLRAWHAGRSKWGGVTDMNSISLGIELDNNGKDPYSEVQLNSLLTLLDTLKTAYRIPPENFIGHNDIAPGRKVDPDINFPWKRLAEHGFGVWYDAELTPPPPTFNPMDGLMIIGYDVSKPSAAIIAFKRHYLPDAVLNDEWTEFAKAVVYNLYLKKKL